MDLSAAEKIVPVTPLLFRSGGNCSKRSFMLGFGYGIQSEFFQNCNYVVLTNCLIKY